MSRKQMSSNYKESIAIKFTALPVLMRFAFTDEILLINDIEILLQVN